MVGVEGWAEIRRLHFVKGLSIREVARRTGHGRNAVRRALRADQPPRYRRPPRPGKLEVELRRLERYHVLVVDEVGCAPRGAIEPGGMRGPPPAAATAGRSWGQPDLPRWGARAEAAPTT
jgi:hypothetical protein